MTHGRTLPLVPLLSLLCLPLAAQQPFGAGPYDPSVPSPRSILGYEVGDRFTSHAMLSRYIERVAAASRRIHVDTVAHTFEGREDFIIVATSEANQGQLEQLRSAMGRLADPRGASASDLAAAESRARPAVLLMYSVHGGEASGVEASIALLYQLAAGQDAETRMILDSCIVLIDPVENPDGHERHVQDVNRMRGAFGVPTSPAAMIQQGTWPGPRTSHYYFDLNRDWYAQSHPETRGRIATMMKWWPVTVADLHEQGFNATYFFPPPMAPVNKNIPESIRRGWDLYASGNIAAFDRQGWSFFRREGYDEFYPGYGDSWPIMTGAVGMTYEQASSNGGAILRSDGTVLTLHDAAWHHYTTSWATLLTTATHARDRLQAYLDFRQAAVAQANQAQHAVVIERDDQGRADSLAARLIDNGIEVQRLRGATEARDAIEYGGSTSAAQLPAGSYMVDLGQPQGTLARSLLEPDAELDSTFIHEELERRREGEPDRFYDITGWTLPLAFRVRAWSTHVPPSGGERVAIADLRGVAPAPVEQAHYGYAFRPGSESSLRLLAGLLADSVKVWFAPRPFAQNGQRFPSGVFVVRVAGNRPDVHERIRARAAEAGASVVALTSAAADEGIDLGSNSSFPVKTPRVALLGGSPISGNSFGFAWFAFEQRLGYPVTPVAAQGLGGATLAGFDVVVIPSVGTGALDNALGEGGKNALAAWVRAGGTLITLDAATSWLANEHTGLARLRVRRDTTRADSTSGAALPSSIPGALVRAYGDTMSPLLAGVRGDIPVLANSDRIYTAPKDLHPGEAVVHYSPKARLRLSGYLWPEMPDRLSESVYLWTEDVGRGRVIGFAGDPNFRDEFRGLLPLFANAVFLGHSM